MTTENQNRVPVEYRWIFKYRWVRIASLFLSAFAAGGGVATKVHEGAVEPGFFEQQAFIMLNMRMSNQEQSVADLKKEVAQVSEKVTDGFSRIEKLIEQRNAALKTIREREQALKELGRKIQQGG